MQGYTVLYLVSSRYPKEYTMNEIIARNISLFRDQRHLSYVELSNWILEKHNYYISPIQIKSYEEGETVSGVELFYIGLSLRVCVAEFFEEFPIFE